MKKSKKRCETRPKTRYRYAFSAQGGQAMVEYAVITACILGGLTLLGTIFLPTMIRAYNIYFQSFYAVLNLPIP